MTTRKDLTTRLSPSSFRPVSLRNDTINGQTPTMFATTSTSPGIDKSWVMMALRKAGRAAIQSLVSAPFRRFTRNSVSENGSRLPKTDQAVRWRQTLQKPQINVGYSINFAWYPLPKYLQTPRPAREDLHEVTQQQRQGQQHPRILPKMVASKVVLALNRLRTATHTRRNVDISHVRTNTQISASRSSNSMLHLP